MMRVAADLLISGLNFFFLMDVWSIKSDRSLSMLGPDSNPNPNLQTGSLLKTWELVPYGSFTWTWETAVSWFVLQWGKTDADIGWNCTIHHEPTAIISLTTNTAAGFHSAEVKVMLWNQRVVIVKHSVCLPRLFFPTASLHEHSGKESDFEKKQ